MTVCYSAVDDENDAGKDGVMVTGLDPQAHSATTVAGFITLCLASDTSGRPNAHGRYCFGLASKCSRSQYSNSSR